MVISVAPAPPEELAPGVRRAGPPTPARLVIALTVAMVFSVSAVFFGVFAFGLAGLQEQRSQHQLYAQFRGLLDPSSPTAPSIGGAIRSGTPVALLNSPDAGLRNVVVVEGTSAGDLLNGPGHLRNSPLPGQVGDSMLVGRSTTAGAPFGGITRLHAGDLITVRTGQGSFRYIVESQVVAGGRLPAIPSGSGLLTLVTSAGRGTLGRLAPDRLVYIDARLDGDAVPAPAGQPTHITPQEIQGHNDPNAWPFALLWLTALTAGTVACWWLWSRWGILQTWLIGAPVLFGVLWGFSYEALRLLPNVY